MSNQNKSGTELFAELVQDRNDTGEKLFARVVKARLLLQDKGWVESMDGGGGDENKALDRIQEECFGNECQILSIVNLLDLLFHFPRVEEWRKFKFNIVKMWADHSSKQKPSRKKEHLPRKVPELPTTAEWEQFSPIMQKKTYERVLGKLETDHQKIARLEEENRTLREENSSLKAQLREIKDKARRLIA